MKNIFLSVASLFFFVFFINAQNSSPYWSLAGNSNATSSSKLGTTNGINLRFYTNNSERARITTSGLFGIGTTSPKERLHVNSASGSNAFRAQVNGSTKLLVHSGGGVSVGSGSTPPTNGLYVSGKVGIGTTTPSYKLQVNGNASVTSGLYVGNNGVYGYNSGGPGLYGSGSSYGVYGTSYDGYGLYATSTNNYGIYSSSANSDGLDAYTSNGYYGVYATSGNSSGTGVYGYGGTEGVYGNGGTYGVYGYGYSGEGVRGYSYNSLGGDFISYNSWGLEASTTNGTYAAVFYGKVYSSTGYTTSDKNLKKNIQEFSGGMNIINKLKPKYYEFKDDAEYASLHLPTGSHYGLLAQDVQEVLPNLVSEAPHQLKTIKPIEAIKPGKDGKHDPIPAEETQTNETINIKAVNYVELIPILVKGMQEQQTQIQSLISKNNEKDKLISDLQNQLNEIKATISKNATGTTITSSGGYLKQSSPNPSNNNTVIGYFTPNETRNAQMLVTDMKGSVLKAFTLSKGEGQVNIRSGELSTGIYNYTLYINNTKIDTKQMIISK